MAGKLKARWGFSECSAVAVMRSNGRRRSSVCMWGSQCRGKVWGAAAEGAYGAAGRCGVQGGSGFPVQLGGAPSLMQKWRCAMQQEEGHPGASSIRVCLLGPMTAAGAAPLSMAQRYVAPSHLEVGQPCL